MMKSGAAKPAYEVQGPFGGDNNYRVTHKETDSRVASCYVKHHADMICDALNLFDHDGTAYIKWLVTSQDEI